VAIRNVLAQSSKKVIVNVVGLAASAASIVAMAGDTITMHSGSVMMIHPAQAANMGSAADFRKMADTLDTVTASLADVYAAKTGLAKDKVLDMMNAETWMDSDEAVKLGFATAVSKDKAAVKNEFDLSTFRNAPASLKVEAKAEEPVVAPPVAEPIVEPPAIVDEAPDLSLFTHQLEINRRK
jgi:ATP-dependent Clp protease protease subunit